MRASPRSTRPLTHPEETTPGPGAQICGYLDLGLLAEASGAARALLRQRTMITAGDFRAAVSAILVSPRRKRWWPLLRRAHRRLSRADRVLVRTAMLRYHLATDNPHAARRHLPAPAVLPTLSADELLTVMEACLLLGRPRGHARWPTSARPGWRSAWMPPTLARSFTPSPSTAPTSASGTSP